MPSHHRTHPNTVKGMVMELTLNNGVTMPALGLGVFQSAPEQTTAAVQSALAAGYRHLDTAAAYGNEREVGEGIRTSGLDRAEVFIETKVWVSDYGYDETLHAWEKAVGKLGVDYLDLLILHQPAPDRFEKTIAAYNAWSPIGGITFYPGWGGEDRRNVMQDPAIAAVAHSYGKTPTQVMLRWHLQQGRSAIPKSTNPARIAENFDVFDFELSAAELAAIDALDTGERNGPDPDEVRPERFAKVIPEA